MPKIKLELVAGDLQNVIGLLHNRLNDAVKIYSRQVIQDNYPDGITRIVTYQNKLYPPDISPDGRKLTAQSDYSILIEPGVENPNAGEVSQRIFYNDAIIVTAWQGKSLLLEVEYIETWQELVNALLDEARNLFGDNQQSEGMRAQPAPVDAGQAGAAALPEIKDPSDKRAWDFIQKDPSMTDSELAAKLNTTRQIANSRRRTLQKMGYTVRVSRQKKQGVKTK